ncbi:hypothetical protein L195_g016175 [Trifolium pratense]|uniref:Uncharacterized protein n=1 Tax=Trifolium pratense TaxID=57577 RepID=A0A2K3MQH6_TRIPR|nr:hypothetical protein L195_g016175 [Trifolium pratense]
MLVQNMSKMNAASTPSSRSVMRSATTCITFCFCASRIAFMAEPRLEFVGREHSGRSLANSRVETRWPTPGEGMITTSAFFIMELRSRYTLAL